MPFLKSLLDTCAARTTSDTRRALRRCRRRRGRCRGRVPQAVTGAGEGWPSWAAARCAQVGAEAHHHCSIPQHTGGARQREECTCVGSPGRPHAVPVKALLDNLRGSIVSPVVCATRPAEESSFYGGQIGQGSSAGGPPCRLHSCSARKSPQRSVSTCDLRGQGMSHARQSEAHNRHRPRGGNTPCRRAIEAQHALLFGPPSHDCRYVLHYCQDVIACSSRGD